MQRSAFCLLPWPRHLREDISGAEGPHKFQQGWSLGRCGVLFFASIIQPGEDTWSGVICPMSITGHRCVGFTEWSMPACPWGRLGHLHNQLMWPSNIAFPSQACSRRWKGYQACCYKGALLWTHVALEPGQSSAVNLEPMKSPSMLPPCLAK